MNKLAIFSGIVAMVLFSGCGSAVRIFSDVDQSASFENYSTYSFLEFSEGNKKTITGMELERIRVAFARELEKRGLKFVESNGDVAVKITVYHREALDGYYYSHWRYNYMERAISVDMYDNNTRTHIWHAAAVGELVYDAEERAALLPDLAARIFERYPVKEVAPA